MSELNVQMRSVSDSGENTNNIYPITKSKNVIVPGIEGLPEENENAEQAFSFLSKELNNLKVSLDNYDIQVFKELKQSNEENVEKVNTLEEYTTTNIESLKTKHDTLYNMVDIMSHNLTTDEGKINDNTDRISTNESNIESLTNRMTDVESKANTNSSNITTITSDVNTLKTDNTTNKNNISSLTTRMSDVESKTNTNATNITDLTSTVSGHTTTLNNHGASIYSLQRSTSLSTNLFDGAYYNDAYSTTTGEVSTNSTTYLSTNKMPVIPGDTIKVSDFPSFNNATIFFYNNGTFIKTNSISQQLPGVLTFSIGTIPETANYFRIQFSSQGAYDIATVDPIKVLGSYSSLSTIEYRIRQLDKRLRKIELGSY